jgi:integrase
MSVHLKPCEKCVAVRKTARNQKKCRLCKWQAVTTPAMGRKSVGVYATKAEAEKALRDYLTARENGTFVESSKSTVNDVVELFLESRRLKLRSEVTVHTYRRLYELRAKDQIGSILVQQLQPSTLSSLYESLLKDGGRKGDALSLKTVRDLQGLIRAVLNYALRNEIVARNVADGVERVGASRREADVHDREAIDKLFAAAQGDRMEALPAIAMFTGLRRGELAALKWSAIDWDLRVLSITESVAEVGGKTWTKGTKTGQVRKVALLDLAIAALRRHKAAQAAERLKAGELYDDQGYVFAPEFGGGYNPNALYKCHARFAKKAGVTTKIHTMRHSFGSWLIRQGVDVVTVSKMLGHGSPATTMRIYAHELEGSQRDAADRLNAVFAAPIATGLQRESGFGA